MGRSWSRCRLGLKNKCLGLVSVSYHRVWFTSQYAQLFASLQNCTCIVLNAGCLYCLLIHKVSFTSLLHTFAIAMQYTIKKVLFLDFANAKSLITSLKSTERSMSASIQSRDRVQSLLTHRSVRVLDSSEYSVQALMVSVALYCLPVSYTHLTLPTNREV